MAGGGRRHYNPTPRTVQATNAALGTTQFWPSSIWQLPDLSSTPPPSAPLQTPKRVVQQPPGSQLAQALDAAVQAAVIRALDFSSGVPPLGKGADDDNASSASCSSTRSLAPDDVGARLRSVIDANVSLHARTEAAEERAEALERRVAELEALVHAERDEREMVVARLEKRINDVARRTHEQNLSLRELLNSVSKSGVRAGSERARVERASREQSASTVRRVESVEAALSQQLAALSGRVAHIEDAESERQAQAAQAKDEPRVSDAFVAQLERNVSDAVTQSVGALRGRIRKLESAGEARRKADEEDHALQMGHVEARLDKSCSDVAALKKLVECNLRAHSSAQDIVKTQVSTVTKHVCAAMRAYTTRRLEEHSTCLLKKIREEMLADEDGDEEGQTGEQIEAVEPAETKSTE